MQKDLIKDSNKRIGCIPNATMGVYIKGKGVVSAWKWANRGSKPYRLKPKESEEWAHLIADCFGGETDADNLVAASFAANSFMNAIEMKLLEFNGRGNVILSAIAYCSKPHVAEFITYSLSSASSSIKALAYLIDATNRHFTKDDWGEIQGEVEQWLKAANIKK